MMASFAVTQSDATPKPGEHQRQRSIVLLLPRVTLLQNDVAPTISFASVLLLPRVTLLQNLLLFANPRPPVLLLPRVTLLQNVTIDAGELP